MFQITKYMDMNSTLIEYSAKFIALFEQYVQITPSADVRSYVTKITGSHWQLYCHVGCCLCADPSVATEHTISRQG
jgi:hypothetical protein